MSPDPPLLLEWFKSFFKIGRNKKELKQNSKNRVLANEILNEVNLVLDKAAEAEKVTLITLLTLPFGGEGL